MAMILLFAQIATQGGKLEGGAAVETGQPEVLRSIDVTPLNYIASLNQTVLYSAYGNFGAVTAAQELLWEDHPEAFSAADVTSQCVWTSSNTAVATIGALSDPQPVTTVGLGQTNITCTIGSVVGFGQLTVAGLVIQPVAIPNAVINTPYTTTFSASGGVAPFTFSITNGLSQLNASGLQLSGNTLSGTPSATGNYGFTVLVTDSSSPAITGTRAYNLTVQPPAGTNTRLAQLPQVWANPAEATFPVPCNTSTHCEQKFIHTTGTTDYPCTYAGVAQSYTDWMAMPANQWREVIVDDGLSAAGQCRITGASQWTLNAKLGATGFYWIHAAHPTPDGETICNHMTAPDPSIDQRMPTTQIQTNVSATCPDAPNHVWYFGSSTIGNSVGPINFGTRDSAGYGPSHIRISNTELETTSTSGNSIDVINLITSNVVPGDPRSMCSHVGFDHNFVHGDRGDDARSARGNNGQGTQVANAIAWGCGLGWLNRNYICCMGRNTESHVISLTDAQPGSMIVGNWVEGNAMQFFVGGRVPSLGDLYNPSDVEMRKNVFGHNPNWIIAAAGATGNAGAGPGCIAGMGMKNNGEFKLGVRILLDGNIMQWSNGCAQDGQILGITVRACSANVCDAYNSVISDLTITNNVFRHGGNLIQTAGRSSGSGAGLGTSLPGRRWNVSNNAGYDIANNSRHRGNTPGYLTRWAGMWGDIRWTCDAARDAAGIVTLDCTNSAFRQISTVSVASTPTQSGGTACTTCYLVHITYTQTTTWTPWGSADRVTIANSTGITGLNGTRTPCSTTTNCPTSPSGSDFYYRCGFGTEPACPTGIGSTVTGLVGKVGFKQTSHAPGDPTVVSSCADTTYNTPGSEVVPTAPTGIAPPPALPGTNGLTPNGLIVKYQSIPGAAGSTTGCVFRNLVGWASDSIVAHNTTIAEDTGTGSMRNPNIMGASAGSTYPYVVNLLFQDNLDVVNPAKSSGGAGFLCCQQQEGITSQRAAFDWGTSEFDYQTLAGRSAQAANYSEVNPTCFKNGNCPRGNSTNPPTTLWFPSLGPCPGSTVTLSGTGWVTGSSSNCIGFKGMMNGVPFLLVSNDTMPPVANGDPLTDYALQPYSTAGGGSGNTCTANCGSPYAAGGPREAHDHTDMGANMNRIRHALQRTIYDDCSAATGNCGAGPNPE